MPTRVKLCAIARNEGAYLADWVFHHLHLGFDAVEVWVNATDDPSLDILARIATVHPQVTGRRADRLLEECLASGKVFQHRAYARMARRARDDGFTHVGFLDLDEYWTPRDLRSPIQAFLPDDPDVNVVSFQWCVDVPDPARAPFTHPLTPPARLQLDGHVKSVSRLDDSVRRYGVHTARTRSGTALLVRTPFAGGSVVPDDVVVEHWGELPEAFVLHATNRSQPEYLASLTKGRRQAGSDVDYNVDRFGFVPTAAPVLELEPEDAARQSYAEARRAFLAQAEVDRLTRDAQEGVHQKARGLVDRVSGDPDLMQLLRGPLHGVREPALDAAYPGWDQRIRWWVDAVQPWGDALTVVGWAFTEPELVPLEFGLRDGDGRDWTDLVVRSTQRPEVSAEHRGAPVACGFEVEVPEELRGGLDRALFLVRAAGSEDWEATRLPARTPSTRG